tara:strand:- start:64 stop:705 length:642 start_codon:yes stop_codon:yes gene_type:complete
MNELIDNVLTGGVAVALIGLAAQLILWYLNNKKDELVDIPTAPATIDSTRYENKIEVQQIIERVMSNSNVSRFLIMKTENSGGKPRLGTHLYASVLYESVKPPLVSVKDDYQRLMVDDIYVRMLSDIGPGTANKLQVGDMKAGILKNIYLVEGITYSEIHYLWETNSAFFYATIATNDEGSTFDEPLDRVEIEIAVSKIREVFKQITLGTYDK